MLLLDTFNILHTTGVLPPELAGLDVAGLADLIQRSRFAGEKTVFLCDGLPAADLPPAGELVLDAHPNAFITVRYSGRTATADDDIRTLIDASTTPRRLTVVSSDHAIVRHARKRRCVALTSEEFLQHLADDANLPQPTGERPRRPSSMSEAQVRSWIDLFSVHEEELRELAPPPDDQHAITTIAQTEPHVAPEPIAPPRATPTPLPADLISEAETMWKRGTEFERRVPPVRNAESSADANSSAQSNPPATPNDPLDMNALLPDDGMTLPLRKRNDRHRPG